MGTQYSSTVTADLAGYDADPPADDGSKTEANKVKWSTVKTKLGNPTKSALENLDTSLVAHLDEGPDAHSAAYTTAAADYNTVLEVTGTTTISLADPTSVGAGYRTTVLNAGSGTVTVDVDGGANVDGAASITIAPGESGTFMVNSAGTLYRSQGGQSPAIGPIPAGTKALFAQASAPTGWTIDTSFDGRMVVVKGTLNDGAVNGGATGGADLPDLMDKVPSHTHNPGTLGGTTGSAGGHTHSFDLFTSSPGNVNFSSSATAFGYQTSGGDHFARTGAPNSSNSNVINAVANHTHSFTVTTGASAANASAANWEPKYMTVIVATKD